MQKQEQKLKFTVGKKDENKVKPNRRQRRAKLRILKRERRKRKKNQHKEKTMPITFDSKTLLEQGKIHFREIKEGDSISEYRNAYADHMEPIDLIESHEIRTGRGWNKWTEEDKKSLPRT
jgi:hypothetical protein